MKERMTVAVLFGGQSSEHEVSCVSVRTVVQAMDPEKYEPLLVGITKEGRWLYTADLEQIESGTWKGSRVQAAILPDASQKCLMLLENGNLQKKKIDVAFPVLHGKFGEDGTIQGLFEMAQIPYAGCGVLSSAVAMDKTFTKIIVGQLGIRQAEYVLIRRRELSSVEECVRRVEEKLSYPVFVKPSSAGSSCGVSRVRGAGELADALQEAAKFDGKILVEQEIVGREVECAVLGGEDPRASNVGEVLAAEEFYSYDAKYNNPDSRTDLHPVFPEGKMEEIREKAVRIFRAIDGFGLARVDFFLEDGTNEVVFNEINTMPGFTSISMYPMLWEDIGVSRSELVDRLISLAFARG